MLVVALVKRPLQDIQKCTYFFCGLADHEVNSVLNALRPQFFLCSEPSRERDEPIRPAILSFADAAKQATAEAGLPAVSQLSHHQSKINLMEHLIQEVASPRTYTLLKEYYKQSKVCLSSCHCRLSEHQNS